MSYTQRLSWNSWENPYQTGSNFNLSSTAEPTQDFSADKLRLTMKIMLLLASIIITDLWLIIYINPTSFKFHTINYTFLQVHLLTNRTVRFCYDIIRGMFDQRLRQLRETVEKSHLPVTRISLGMGALDANGFFSFFKPKFAANSGRLG